MLPSSHDPVESAIAQCRFSEASALVGPTPGRLQAALAALAGDDRALAATANEQLLDCRDEQAAAAYLAAGSNAYDCFAIAAVLAWSGESEGVYRALRDARERALVQGRAHLAVAALERLAHHALLFGDVVLARASLSDAMQVAGANGLERWHLRTGAAAAALAYDAGDPDTAAALVAGARASGLPLEDLALFAGTAAALAGERGDELEALRAPEMLEIALRGSDRRAAVGAAIGAAVFAGAMPPLEPSAGLALRRALLWAGSAADAPALFSIGARCADLDLAAYAVDSLRALPAPDRPYLRSHYLLARAYLAFRSGDDASWIDDAGDAARSFNAMGLRRWTNEAMLQLVRQEGDTERRRRRRPSASALTGREQQVAQLIRRGARNREVALALQISEHTVERHVSSILGRLGLRSRWQIAESQNAEH